jgi:uncharacterized protein (TIGR00369 family)
MRSRLIEKLQTAEKELARRIRETNVGRFFGFVLESAEPGRAVLVLRVKPHHRQVHGVVHGGIVAALADTAGGMATYMSVPRGARLATVEMKINFLEAVEKGTMVAEARVLRCGRNFSVVDCDVRDSAGRLAAKALMTFAINRVEEKSAEEEKTPGSRRSPRKQRRG